MSIGLRRPAKWRYSPQALPTTVRAFRTRFLRSVARAVVLGVFLLALTGPWADSLSILPTPLAYALITVGAAVPLASMAAILRPSSSLATFLYRVSGGAAAALTIAALAWMLRVAPEGRTIGGLVLCLGALVLGAAVEILPRPRERRRDYADVFR